jgi:DNA polymerase
METPANTGIETPMAAAKPAAKIGPSVTLKPDGFSLVLFVGDSFTAGDDLLGKMIVAMKLRPGEFNRVAFNEKLEDVNDLAANLTVPSTETVELLEQIIKFKPNIVVSLGATVTNILLGKREKLSGIHGQFFEKSFSLNNESYTYQLMPIFHPDFLVINPNMKRTAWIDLQKVMERVGKI